MMKAWNDFVKRVLPEHWDQVFAEKMPPENGREVYEIAGEEGMVLLRGSSVNSLAAALGWYLRYDAEVNLSWCGSRMELPKFLPKPAPYRRVIEQKYRAYFNYCTFNYSASWWDWQRWEKELDFMALQGVNLPLSAVGIECTWYETLRELGFTEEEALAFFSGPAFLAWQWMTNIEGFAGPIPKSWIEKRRVLGQQIIQRQLALGMTPIQQGFSGFGAAPAAREAAKGADPAQGRLVRHCGHGTAGSHRPRLSEDRADLSGKAEGAVRRLWILCGGSLSRGDSACGHAGISPGGGQGH